MRGYAKHLIGLPLRVLSTQQQEHECYSIHHLRIKLHFPHVHGSMNTMGHVQGK